MIKAEFNESINDLTTENLYQWDSYQTLVISGIDFEAVSPKVHFCNKKPPGTIYVAIAINIIIEKIITNVCGTFIPLLNFFQKPFLSFSTTFCISLKSPLNLLCDILVEGDIFLKASC